MRVGTRGAYLFRSELPFAIFHDGSPIQLPEMRRFTRSNIREFRHRSQHLKKLWRERRLDNSPVEQSGVWRYREMMAFLDDTRHIVTLREGNTPLLPGTKAAIMAVSTALSSSTRALIRRGHLKTMG